MESNPTAVFNDGQIRAYSTKKLAGNSMIGSCHTVDLTAKSLWLAEGVDSAGLGGLWNGTGTGRDAFLPNPPDDLFRGVTKGVGRCFSGSPPNPLLVRSVCTVNK